MLTEKILFLTMNKQTLRVAITLRPEAGGVVYTKEMDAADYEVGWDSYCMYDGMLTKEEIIQLMELYECGKQSTVYSILRKKLNDSEIQKKKIGPMDFGRMTDRVPDDWFDGCEFVLDLLEFKRVKGIVEQNIEEYETGL